MNPSPQRMYCSRIAVNSTCTVQGTNQQSDRTVWLTNQQRENTFCTVLAEQSANRALLLHILADQSATKEHLLHNLADQLATRYLINSLDNQSINNIFCTDHLTYQQPENMVPVPYLLTIQAVLRIRIRDPVLF